MMRPVARVDYTVHVSRPPAEVFEHLTDPDKLVRWQEGLIEMRKESDEPLRVGARLHEVRTFLGRRASSTLEVTRYEPARAFSIKALSAPLPFEVHQTLEPENAGTRITVVAEARVGRFMRLATGVAIKAAERQTRDDFQRLKRLLESEAVEE